MLSLRSEMRSMIYKEFETQKNQKIIKISNNERINKAELYTYYIFWKEFRCLGLNEDIFEIIFQYNLNYIAIFHIYKNHKLSGPIDILTFHEEQDLFVCKEKQLRVYTDFTKVKQIADATLFDYVFGFYFGLWNQTKFLFGIQRYQSTKEINQHYDNYVLLDLKQFSYNNKATFCFTSEQYFPHFYVENPFYKSN